MKYILLPILKLLLVILVAILYLGGQIINILWCLKPNPNLFKDLIGTDFWYRSHRHSIYSTCFVHTEWYKHIAVPNSLFEYMIWLLKYGFTGEVTELSKKESEVYQKFCENHEKIS